MSYWIVKIIQIVSTIIAIKKINNTPPSVTFQITLFVFRIPTRARRNSTTAKVFLNANITYPLHIIGQILAILSVKRSINQPAEKVRSWLNSNSFLNKINKSKINKIPLTKRLFPRSGALTLVLELSCKVWHMS